MAGKGKTPKYVHPANPSRVEAENLRRRSHAAGSHDQGPHRERSRKASKDAAIKRDMS